jgi:hypothetical protein
VLLIGGQHGFSEEITWTTAQAATAVSLMVMKVPSSQNRHNN